MAEPSSFLLSKIFLQIICADLYRIERIAGARVLLNNVGLNACLACSLDYAVPVNSTVADLGHGGEDLL